MTVVNATRPTASSPIGRRLDRNPKYDDPSPAEYSRGVRTTSITMFGSNVTSTVPGTSETSRPTTTRTSGAESPTRRQTAVTASEPRTRVMRASSVLTSDGLPGAG